MHSDNYLDVTVTVSLFSTLPLPSMFYNTNKGIQEFYLVGSLGGAILKQTCVESSHGKYLCLLKLTQLTNFKRKFLHFLLHFVYFLTVSVKQARYSKDCQTSVD